MKKGQEIWYIIIYIMYAFYYIMLFLAYILGDFYGLRGEVDLGGVCAMGFRVRVLSDGPSAVERGWSALASGKGAHRYVAAPGGVHIVVASVSRKEPRDERARLIEYKGYKAAYLTAETVFAWWLLGWYLPQNSKEPHKELPLLLAGWLAVEAIRVGTQLTLYRTSVRV